MQFANYEAKEMEQKVHILWKKVIQDSEYNEAPDENDEGFWPSQNQNNAGYCGDVSDERFQEIHNAAKQRYNDWEDGVWNYIGVRAKASLYIPIGSNSFHILELESAGLWGIESDSGKYLDDVYQEQKAELKNELELLAKALTSNNIIEKES